MLGDHSEYLVQLRMYPDGSCANPVLVGKLRRIGWDTRCAYPVLVGHSWRIGWDAFRRQSLERTEQGGNPLGLQTLGSDMPLRL